MYQGSFTIGHNYDYRSNAKGNKTYVYLGLSGKGQHRIQFTDEVHQESHFTEGVLREVTLGDLGLSKLAESILGGEPKEVTEEPPVGISLREGAKYATIIPDHPELTVEDIDTDTGECTVVIPSGPGVQVMDIAVLWALVAKEIPTEKPKLSSVEYRNVYKDGADRLYCSASARESRAEADSTAAPSRAGCIKITLTEGHYDD